MSTFGLGRKIFESIESKKKACDDVIVWGFPRTLPFSSETSVKTAEIDGKTQPMTSLRKHSKLIQAKTFLSPKISELSTSKLLSTMFPSFQQPERALSERKHRPKRQENLVSAEIRDNHVESIRRQRKYRRRTVLLSFALHL